MPQARELLRAAAVGRDDHRPELGQLFLHGLHAALHAQAVIAETADWVAMASEYRALSGLPGVGAAKIWEPEPEVVYAWQR